MLQLLLKLWMLADLRRQLANPRPELLDASLKRDHYRLRLPNLVGIVLGKLRGKALAPGGSLHPRHRFP